MLYNPNEHVVAVPMITSRRSHRPPHYNPHRIQNKSLMWGKTHSPD